jgi:hypothetical protein
MRSVGYWTRKGRIFDQRPKWMSLIDTFDWLRMASRARTRRRCGLSRLLLVPLIIACLLLPSLVLRGQQAKASEYDVKAAYLYNFGRFVQWPDAAEKNGSFAICVLGQDPFGPSLDATLTGQAVNGKQVVTRRISKPEDGLSCRVLFISASEDSRLRNILATLDKTGVLTVSDMRDFSQRGGMIQFVLDGSRIRFEVNLANTGNAGLTLSSELLKVAVAVRRNSAPGE